MKIIVDTSIWSLALRRHRPDDMRIVDELQQLILESRVQMLGAIRQELLQGIRAKASFQRVRTVLAAFPDLPLESEDYENAASMYNQCRAKGLQGSNTDFLICAVSVHHQMPILTTDNDFHHFTAQLPLQVMHRSL